MLSDLSLTFCFTIYDFRLLQDFLISCLLTCTDITCLCVPMLSTLFSIHVSDSDLSIYVYLLDFGFTTDPLIFIYVTGHCLYLYARSHHMIVYTCDCLSMPTGLSYVLVGLLSDNSEFSCPDLRVRIVVAMRWLIIVRSGSVDKLLYVRTLFSSSPRWSAHEILIFLLVNIFQSFILHIMLLRFLVI